MKYDKSKIRSLAPDETGKIDFDEFAFFWKNKQFRKYVIGEVFDKIVIKMFKELLKIMPENIKKNLVIKGESFLGPNDLWHHPIFKNILRNIEDMIDLVFPNLKSEISFVILMERFFIRTLQTKKISKLDWFNDVEEKGDILDFYNLYNYMIKERLVSYEYTQPVLNNKSKAFDEYIVKKNINFIENENYILINLKDIPKNNWLRKYEIDKSIGRGSFGVVFSFKNENFVIKIFKERTSGIKELRRYAKMAKRVFSGASTLAELHVYDYGKLKDIYGNFIYYVVMPRLIAGDLVADKFRIECGIDLFHVVRKLARHLVSDNPDKIRRMNLKHFLDMIEYELGTRSFNITQMQYITAAYRALKDYKGTDFNFGNIGYFAGHEDKPFFFDM